MAKPSSEKETSFKTDGKSVTSKWFSNLKLEDVLQLKIENAPEVDCHAAGPWELLGLKLGILTQKEAGMNGWRWKVPHKWAAILNRARELGIEVPKAPEGDNTSDLRRDIVRYCREVILGCEQVKCLSSGEFVVYIGGVYKFGGDTLLGTMIQYLGGPETTNNVVSEILGQLRRLNPGNLLDFDKDPYRISCLNGIIDLRTGKLEPHDPRFLTVIQLPVKFNPDADCPAIRKFMSEVVKPKDIPLLEEMAGYCLFKSCPIHKGFLLLGEGRNGKSVWINLLVALVGLENTASVPLHQLSYKFKAAELKGKLINFYTDLPNMTVSVADAFKILTAGDIMTIEEKYQKPQKMKNYSKQIFSANQAPKTLDETYGFFSRLIVVDFPNRFEGDKADKYLLDKLSTPVELSGLLNLAIAGLKRLLQKERFSYSMSVDEVADYYRLKSNPAVAALPFLGAACMKDANGFAPKDDLWLAYSGWLQETGEEQCFNDKDSLMNAIRSAWGSYNSRRRMKNDVRVSCLAGLVLTGEGERFMGVIQTPSSSKAPNLATV
ncbi:MAG: phage/plasmid primase, P4 family [Methanothrix sp.]|nr:phage/plasmid primase, P4 family [Methanothrix sp.]